MNSKIIILGFYFWFVISGIFIAERAGLENWIFSLLAYSLGLYYVYPFLMGTPMSVPYLDKSLPAEPNNIILRLILFIPALLLSLIVSIQRF